MEKFNEVKKANLKKLNLFVPVVERVHGGSHPEFYEVRKIFDVINEKIKDNKSDNLDIDRELEELRKVTNNYTVPSDVCESYEAVYNMLAELDRAYQED